MDPLEAFGWDDRVADRFADVGAEVEAKVGVEGAVPARIRRVDRGMAMAVTGAGDRRVTWQGLRSRRAGVDQPPAVGDWVAVADDAEEGWVVVALVPRWSVLRRRTPEDRERDEQVLAANVDVMAAVSALDRPFSDGRAARLLALAWDGGVEPVLVLTKADAAKAGRRRRAEEAARSISAGAEVIVTSSATGEGVDAVQALARPRRTLAFVGPSGAGKSSLVNRLLGSEVQDVGAVREGDARGRHTTVTRDLIPLPGGGVLLDTPGLRSLGLIDAEAGLAAAFPEIEALAGGCRFADCAHDSEPGCAVSAAVERGALDAGRVESWRKLHGELGPTTGSGAAGRRRSGR